MSATSSSSDESEQDWTVGKVLRWAADDFRKRGIETPRLDAELLLGHVLGCERVTLIVDSQRPLASSELGAYRDAIKRRRRGEPVAYVLGVREFYGLEFHVDSRALIPRPDTETLVEVALRRTRGANLYGRALDLCTGSGCVAIAFKHARDTWQVTGSDASADAIALARENGQRLAPLWNLRWVVSDLFAQLGPDERFELITANPPYIPAKDIHHLDPDIRDFEPRLALDGGDDGLALTQRLVPAAAARLTAGGVLALEIQYDQGDAVAELLERAGLSDIERERDYGHHERVVSGKKR